MAADIILQHPSADTLIKLSSAAARWQPFDKTTARTMRAFAAISNCSPLLYDQRQKWGIESGSAQSEFNYSTEYVQPPTIVLFSVCTSTSFIGRFPGVPAARDLESALR